MKDKTTIIIGDIILPPRPGCMDWGAGPPTPRTGPLKPNGAAVIDTGGTAIPVQY